jgi:hypothetical protein
MRNVCTLWMSVSLVVLCCMPSFAIQPFYDVFKEKYAKPGTPFEQKVEQTKCNVCHKGTKKKDRNAYGEAVAKHLKKADFQGDTKKFDPKSDEGKRAIAEGLEKVGKDTAPNGKQFKELIEAGELPDVPKN